MDNENYGFRVGALLGPRGFCWLTAFGLALSGCSSAEKEAASKNGVDGCPVNTGFEGDDACIAAPSQGMMLHYGPSDYDDPAEVALYTLAPGEEVNKCLFFKAPNATDFYYSKMRGHLRPGSHHLIARAMADRTETDGLHDCGSVGMLGQADDIGTSTYKDWEFPPAAPEFAGVAGVIPGGRTIMLNGHFIDSSEAPMLAEAWMVYDEIAQSQVTKVAQQLSLVGGLGFQIAPGTHQTYSYSCNAPSQPVTVMQAVGHFHAHTLHFSGSKRTASGVTTPVLDMFHWEELRTYDFDSITTNPVADAATKTDGAWTGTLTLSPTDFIDWSCEINNDGTGTLKFRNEVQTGEMCIFGGLILSEVGTTQPYLCARN